MTGHRDAPLQILIVDNSPEDRACYRRLLQDPRARAYDMREAGTGEEGLAVCRAKPLDCVLLDSRLPDLDSRAFLTALAGEEGIRSIPVIVLADQGSETLAVDVMKAGAADYMPKSVVSAKALGRAIDNAVNQAQLRATLEEQDRILAQTNQELRRKQEEIQSFYHMLSHELKTPLTATYEFVAIVLDGLAGPLTELQSEYLTRAKDSCHQIKRGLTDLLDATRLDTGKFHIAPRQSSIGTVVAQAVASMAPIAHGRGICLQHAIAADLPEVWIDEQRIAQVLTNLLSNALKFTPSGGEVLVGVSNHREQPAYICISVSDTGRGIEAEHLGHIFDRLYQVRTDDAEIEGGLGLGLYICRELVRLHGGEIWVDSMRGLGSTFTFTLPAHRVDVTSAGR
jgi:two-component system, sensor histidine kinase and response regulator